MLRCVSDIFFFVCGIDWEMEMSYSSKIIVFRKGAAAIFRKGAALI